VWKNAPMKKQECEVTKGAFHEVIGVCFLN
jgi:hypothetical protein